MKNELKKAFKIPGLLIATFFTIFFLALLNQYWKSVSFLEDSFFSVLWLINISTAVSMLCMWIEAFINNYPLKAFIKLVQNTFSLIVLINFCTLFPFNFNYGLATVTKVILVVVIFGTIIGTIVEFIKLIAKTEKD